MQHDGRPCGTCFFSISEELNNQDRQAVLLYRGDYKKEDLDNLPDDIEKQLEIDGLNKDQKKAILNQFDMRVLNKKTMMSCGNANIKLESENLYINIDEVNLI